MRPECSHRVHRGGEGVLGTERSVPFHHHGHRHGQNLARAISSISDQGTLMYSHLALREAAMIDIRNSRPSASQREGQRSRRVGWESFVSWVVFTVLWVVLRLLSGSFYGGVGSPRTCAAGRSMQKPPVATAVSGSLGPTRTGPASRPNSTPRARSSSGTCPSSSGLWKVRK